MQHMERYVCSWKQGWFMYSQWPSGYEELVMVYSRHCALQSVSTASMPCYIAVLAVLQIAVVMFTSHGCLQQDKIMTPDSVHGCL